MNKVSLAILVPIGALLGGVVYSTFIHEYDTSRNLFQDRNLTIEDLMGIGGNIISLQKDASGNIIWIVSGKWQLDLRPGDNTTTRTDRVDFRSNVTLENVDGISNIKLSLSNFTLLRSQIVDEIVTLDGTVSVNKMGRALLGEDQSKTIPIRIVISNGRVIQISSNAESFHNYFAASPVYGNVPQRDRV